MSEFRLPRSPDELVERLRFLHEERRRLPRPARRLSLTAAQRADVLKKTDSRCHLCGGVITKNKSVADHVLSHKAGGEHKLANYLPAHGLCNRCRWFYSPEEFQWILRIGVWARKQMEDQKKQIGKDMLREFWNRPKKKTRSSGDPDTVPSPFPLRLEWLWLSRDSGYSMSNRNQCSESELKGQSDNTESYTAWRCASPTQG